MPEIRQPLWFKLSVDFYDHPKVFTLSIHERELYQRAICYSRRHLTDGFLSRDTLRQLGKPLVSDLCECIRKGRHWEEVCDSWIEVLAKVTLLDRIDENFLQVHGFLDWNPSRSHVESITSMRREYGSKGGKLKHINMLDAKQNAKQNASKRLANDLVKVYPETETETETETEIKKKSSASQVRKPSKPTLTDMEWIESLKSNPAYQHINFDVENGKMDAWLSLPKNKHRIKTRKFILSWINRQEKPIEVQSRLDKCQARVKRDNFYEPCGEIAVTQCAGKPMCRTHKEQYATR